MHRGERLQAEVEHRDRAVYQGSPRLSRRSDHIIWVASVRQYSHLQFNIYRLLIARKSAPRDDRRRRPAVVKRPADDVMTANRRVPAGCVRVEREDDLVTRTSQ